MSDAEIMGSVGVTLLLIAFFLNQFGLLRASTYTYMGLNLVGAGLSCLSSYLIDFMPFVVLEGTWAAVAAVALIRTLAFGRRDPDAAG